MSENDFQDRDLQDLDAVLMAPLPNVDDNGFSVRILMKIEEAQAMKWTLLATGAAACMAVAMAFLPWQPLLDKAMHSASSLFSQPALYIAVTAVAFLVMLDKPSVRS